MDYKRLEINEGVKAFAGEEGAVLLDVRARQEYDSGHIPGSVNVPLLELGYIDETIPEMSTPVYVYCLSGGRSRHAVAVLMQMGYENVYDIGGIERYEGEIEK